MRFSENISSLLQKINQWNEDQKQKAIQRQPLLQKRLEEQATELHHLAKQIPHDILEKPISPLQNESPEINIIDEIPIADYPLTVNVSTIVRTRQPQPLSFEECGPLEKEYVRCSARFQAKQCPYCFTVIEQLSNRSRVCPHCKQRFYIRKNLCTQEYMLLSAEEFTLLQQERLSKEWETLSREVDYYLNRREYGLYWATKYHLLTTGCSLQKFTPYEILVKTFELYYLDFSGPNNVHNIRPNIQPAFSRNPNIKTPPGLLDLLESALEQYPKTLGEYEAIFLLEMEKLRLPEQKTLPTTAWKALKKEIKFWLLS